MSLSVFLGLQGPPGWPLVSFGNLFLTLGAFRGSRERSCRVPGLPRGPRDVSSDAREGASRCLSSPWGGLAASLGALGRSNYAFGELMVGFESIEIC